MNLKKYIGDREFYSMVLAVAVPIMIQNGITNVVGMLDNLMVGRIGTEQMSGVAIVNQLMFVYYLMIFGGLAGAGIFTAQYFGKGDQEGIAETFRYKMWFGFFIALFAFLVLYFGGDFLIGAFLNGDNGNGSLDVAMYYAKRYLMIMFWSLPLVWISNVYTSTLRECGETIIPMAAGLLAVVVNLFLNYVLIFGKLGMPELGVEGAALATVISRVAELLVAIIFTHMNTARFAYAAGIYRKLTVSGDLAARFFLKGFPLLVNETLWAAGVSWIMQCYSVRGLAVVAGLNISNTINNVFNVAFIAMGDAVAIIVGRLLGAGRMEEAKDVDRKIMAFDVAIATVVGMLLFACATLFPRLYNTTEEVRLLASRFIMVQAAFYPVFAFLHCAYFTLRSGGKTVITFLFDSFYVCVLTIPLAFALSHYTTMYVIGIYACVQASDLIKCVVGYILVKKGVWLNNLVAKEQTV